MSVTVVIGSQWGDEGKGKLIDYLAGGYDFVVRYNGSAGAAHSVVNRFGSFKFHLLPSGVFHQQVKICLTNGVFVEPELLLSEIKMVEKTGIKLSNRLFLSPRCHLVFPYHKILDGLLNSAFSRSKTSPTTGRGNGPVNADKISYHGIRLYNLLDKKVFSERLKIALEIKNKIIVSLGGQPLEYNKIFSDYLKYTEHLKPYIKETLPILEKAVLQKKKIIFESVNGFFLDNDWGAYPHVTTASILPTDILRGAGVNPYLTSHQIIGVAKAYMTRVDNGECPLPTEWPVNLETKNFRDRAGEYGSGTGRPRRIAWFDSEVVKFSHRLCCFDDLCLTRLDTLSGLKKIKICSGYELNGKKVSYLDGDAEFYRKVKPLYEEFNGWREDLGSYRKYGQLPVNVKKYVERIEKLVGVHIKYLSVGPEREKLIRR